MQLIQKSALCCKAANLFVHNRRVRGGVNALTVFNDQYLRRLVFNAVTSCNFARHVAMSNQVEVVRFNFFITLPLSFHAAKGHGADIAARAVF